MCRRKDLMLIWNSRLLRLTAYYGNAIVTLRIINIRPTVSSQMRYLAFLCLKSFSLVPIAVSVQSNYLIALAAGCQPKPGLKSLSVACKQSRSDSVRTHTHTQRTNNSHNHRLILPDNPTDRGVSIHKPANPDRLHHTHTSNTFQKIRWW